MSIDDMYRYQIAQDSAERELNYAMNRSIRNGAPPPSPDTSGGFPNIAIPQQPRYDQDAAYFQQSGLYSQRQPQYVQSVQRPQNVQSVQRPQNVQQPPYGRQVPNNQVRYDQGGITPQTLYTRPQ